MDRKPSAKKRTAAQLAANNLSQKRYQKTLKQEMEAKDKANKEELKLHRDIIILLLEGKVSFQEQNLIELLAAFVLKVSLSSSHRELEI